MTELGPAGASALDRYEQHLIAGGELLRQNRLVDAQRELLAALEAQPDSAKALALLGLAYFRGSRFAEALPVYRRLVAAAPTDASYHLNLGLVLLKLGDADGAASALEKSRDLDPSQGRAVSYLGLAYARGGRFAEAYQAFLLAGQGDLAREIAENLSPDERARIEANLRRSAAAAKPPPKAAPPASEPAPVPVTDSSDASESSRFVARGLGPAGATAGPDDEDDHPVIIAETPSAIDVLAQARAQARAEAMANGRDPDIAASEDATAGDEGIAAGDGAASSDAASSDDGVTASGAMFDAPDAPADDRATRDDADGESTGAAIDALDASDDDAFDAIESHPAESPTAAAEAAPDTSGPSTTDGRTARRSLPPLPAIPRRATTVLPSAERAAERAERPDRAATDRAADRLAFAAGLAAAAADRADAARHEAPDAAIGGGPRTADGVAMDDLDGVVAEVARGAISRAVAQLAPSAAHGPDGRVAAGHRPPQPLSEFATTRLVRLEDGDEPFEISAGGVLIVRVTDKMYSRTEGVDVTGGQLGYEPALRRSRGQNRTEPFATAGRPMFSVTGRGHLIAAPLGGQFTAVTLDDDIFYLREDLVFAFEPALRWENGHVPGSRERIPMVQFRGSGAVAFRTERPLLSVKLAQERVLYVDATALAGWIGRVVPRAVTPADDGPGSELFVECTGEGVVLVEEEQAPRPASPAR